MNENAKELLDLVKARPDLPIVPMVWEEIVADSASCYWRGSFGKAKVEKYWMGYEHIYFYDEDDIEGVLYDGGAPWPSEAVDMADNETALNMYRSLPWTEAIVVYIEMPD